MKSQELKAMKYLATIKPSKFRLETESSDDSFTIRLLEEVESHYLMSGDYFYWDVIHTVSYKYKQGEE